MIKKLFKAETMLLLLIILMLLPTAAASASQSDSSDWQTVVSSVPNILASAYNNNGQYVVVGGNGEIRTSADGYNWTKQNSGTIETLRDVIWNGEKYVAVGTNGTILTSSDGINWTAQVSNTDYTLSNIAWDGGQYIAVGWDYRVVEEDYATLHNVILRSDDAVTWEILPIDPQLMTGNIAIKGNIDIITFDNGICLLSTNGVDWTTVDMGFTDSWILGIACNDQIFVAVGSDGLILTSADGLTWQKQTSPTEKYIIDVIWNGKKFIAITGYGDILSSTDGKSWSSKTIDATNYQQNINYAGGLYVITGNVSSILVSNDGVSWQETCGDNLINCYITSIANNNRVFAAVGGGLFLASTDGLQWSGSSLSDTYRDVIWDGNRFVAVGDNGTFMTSVNGYNWSVKTYNIFSNPEKIIWSGSQYVIVGEDALILTSPDGENWTQRECKDLDEYDWLTSIAWNGKMYVAVGMFGTIITSPDGVNWTIQNPPTAVDLDSVVWGGSKFVAVGDRKTVVASTDGIHWSKVLQTTVPYALAKSDYEINNIVWDGQQYIALFMGDNGTVMLSSTDAINWQETETGINEYFDAISWNGYRYVAASNNGTIITCLPRDIIKVTVDQVPISFDIAPTIISGRTVVPLRAIFDTLGAEVEWDQATQTITAHKDNTMVVLQVGSNQATVNGETVQLEVPATIAGGRTMVPARFIAESFDCSVDWDDQTRTVVISSD